MPRLILVVENDPPLLQTLADTVSKLLTRRGAPQPRTSGPDAANDHRLGAAQLALAAHALAATERARADLESLFAADTSPAIALALARATVLMLERGGLTPPQPPDASLRRIDALVDYNATTGTGGWYEPGDL